jgi:hypothetical protein
VMDNAGGLGLVELCRAAQQSHEAIGDAWRVDGHKQVILTAALALVSSILLDQVPSQAVT